jgi:hypothetical protein
MEALHSAQARPQHPQLSVDHTFARVPKTPKFNALRHGLYAEAILLPGDNVAEFRRGRENLFLTYQPQTVDEAELVESMAEFKWLRLRCRPLVAQYDGQAAAPEADAAGRVCEPDGHQRLHSAIDAMKNRQRIERLWNNARRALMEAQKLRRQGLVPGAARLPPGCYLDSSGEVVGLVIADTLPGGDARPTHDSLSGGDARPTMGNGAGEPESYSGPGVPARLGAGSAASDSGDCEIRNNLERAAADWKTTEPAPHRPLSGLRPPFPHLPGKGFSWTGSG